MTVEIPLRKKYREAKRGKSTPYASRTGNRMGNRSKRMKRKERLRARARYLKGAQKEYGKG